VIESIRFETTDRYYLIDCYRDMLDDIVVVCTYGSKYSKSYYRKIIHVDSVNVAKDTIAKIAKVRYRHGYELIYGES
jgi:hypothetical protein